LDNKLFVASLPWEVDDQELGDIFSRAGNVVSAVVIKNHETKKSKGFGFVTMIDAAAAQSAIAQLDNIDYNGRKLVVKIAKPREDRRPIHA